MADLTITAANVAAGAGATVKHGTAGATITAGKSLAQDPATSKYVLSDSNHATAWMRKVRAISLNGASDGQPLAVVTKGPVTIGATLTAGATYFASDTPGGICPDADVGSGEEVSMVGIAISTTVLDVNPINSGVAR